MNKPVMTWKHGGGLVPQQPPQDEATEATEADTPKEKKKVELAGPTTVAGGSATLTQGG